MAIDTHIKFDGVDGEATHKDHKNEIEVLSWAWGVSNATNVVAGGGSGKGKAEPGDLHFMHTLRQGLADPGQEVRPGRALQGGGADLAQGR